MDDQKMRPDAVSRVIPGRYYIETWGCQMNVHDSEKIAGSLDHEGYLRAETAQEADIVLLNTCSIREKAEEKMFSQLGRLRALKDMNPSLVLGVCGCVAQQEGAKIFDRAPYVDIVIGTRATGSLPMLINRLRAGDEEARHTADTEYRDDSIHFPFDLIRRAGGGAAKAFVTVIEGCNHRCTFCIVPTTRGRETCRDMDDILEEVRNLASSGTREVEFLGQTVNAYRDGSSRTLADLLVASAEITGIERIRFTTSHPAQMTERLMDAMVCGYPKVCPYLHLPVQSGSSAVLQDMRRGYDRTGYLRKIEYLRHRVPGIAFGTDIIVGFPTERDSDFEDTLTLLNEVEYQTVYSFVYSRRPGTPAAHLDDPIPLASKLERLSNLQARQRAIQERLHRSSLGKEMTVLVEGASKRDPGEWTGRTPESRIVNFPGTAAPGRLVRVRITSSTAVSLRGELLKGTA